MPLPVEEISVTTAAVVVIAPLKVAAPVYALKIVGLEPFDPIFTKVDEFVGENCNSIAAPYLFN